MRHEPAHDIGDFLIRHGSSGDGLAPVGGAEFWAPHNHHRSQSLIARQRQERIVRDRASLRAALAFSTVAGFAVGSVDDFPTLNVARKLRSVSSSPRFHGRCDS